MNPIGIDTSRALGNVGLSPAGGPASTRPPELSSIAGGFQTPPPSYSINTPLSTTTLNVLTLLGTLGNNLSSPRNVIALLNKLLTQAFGNFQHEAKNLLLGAQNSIPSILTTLNSSLASPLPGYLQPVFSDLSTSSLESAIREALKVNLRQIATVDAQSSDATWQKLLATSKDNFLESVKDLGKSLQLSFLGGEGVLRSGELNFNTTQLTTNQNLPHVNQKIINTPVPPRQLRGRGSIVPPPKALPYDEKKPPQSRPLRNQSGQTIFQFLQKAVSWLRSLFAK